MEWYVSGLILIVALIVLLSIGLPIFFSLGLISLTGLFLALGLDKSIRAMATTGYWTVDSFVLIAIPMFIFMAEIVLFSGVGHDLFETMERWFGRLPGGLALATNASCGMFAAVCGASVATAATVGVVAIPEMMKQGYDKKLAVGTVAAGGSIGILIPPSIPMILYAFIAEQSVGALFIAGIIPGIISVTIYFLAIMLYCTRKPEWAPGYAGFTWKQRFSSLYKVLPIVFLIILVLGSIYAGIATPTEAASVGAAGALLISVITRRLTWANLRKAMLRTTQTSCFMLLIVVTAKIFGLLLTNLLIPQGLTQFVAGFEMSRWWVMIGIMVMLFFGGMFLDVGSLILISIPVLFPISQGLGFDPIWFGVILMINMEMAVITPPVGLNLYVIRGISGRFGVSLGDVIRGVLLFLPWDVVRLSIMMAFPILSLWLPSHML